MIAAETVADLEAALEQFQLIAEDLGSDGAQGALFQPNADEWPLRPTDMLVAKEYRELLLELEHAGTISVFDANTGIERPAAKRRKKTLAGRYEIRLCPDQRPRV